MSRARWWLLGGVAGLVVVAAGLWLWSSTNRSSTPEEAALAYVQALESGDADAVAATGIDVSDTALVAFAAATAFIEDSEVTTVRREDDDTSAVVAISFRLAGKTHTAQLTLGIVDGRWSVDETGLGTLTVETTIGSDVAIGDATVPAETAALLLPATYALAAAPEALLEGGSAALVLPGVKTTTTLDVMLRPEATAVAQAQLDTLLETCTAGGTEVPDGCGIRIPWGTEFREVDAIRYRIDTAPVIALTPAGFTAEGGVLVATITGTAQNGEARTTTYRTDSWSVRGDLAFTADGLLLSVW